MPSDYLIEPYRRRHNGDHLRFSLSDAVAVVTFRPLCHGLSVYLFQQHIKNQETKQETITLLGDLQMMTGNHTKSKIVEQTGIDALVSEIFIHYMPKEKH